MEMCRGWEKLGIAEDLNPEYCAWSIMCKGKGYWTWLER